MSESLFVDAERLRDSFAARSSAIVDAARRAELVLGSGFLVAATCLAVFGRSGTSLSLPLAVLYVGSMAAIGQVRLEIGAGFTVPMQAVFVPMLFALPAQAAPLFVLVSLLLGAAPKIVAGRAPLSRLLALPGNSWFAVGPALVLTLAGDVRPDARPVLLLLAFSSQFVCDFAANVIREHIRGGVSIADLAGEMRLIWLIDIALAPLGLVVAVADESHRWEFLLIAPLFGVLGWLARERRTRMDHLIELNHAYHGTALLLGDVVEADDSYTGAHCKDVVELALNVARVLGLDAMQTRRVEFGALLHDVGKIAVPKEIVNKPGKLDKHEWAIIKAHTTEGQKMLEQVGGFMHDVGAIVRSHHERWDGGGYPDGLREEQIPLEARIVSCCDTFNAMTTTRSYRAAMPVHAAIAELVTNAGSQFDPAVVDALIATLQND